MTTWSTNLGEAIVGALDSVGFLRVFISRA
jgi:hypothetical protein